VRALSLSRYIRGEDDDSLPLPHLLQKPRAPPHSKRNFCLRRMHGLTRITLPLSSVLTVARRGQFSRSNRAATYIRHHNTKNIATMSGVVKKVEPLSFPFQTPDPFLFAVYHNDAYPAGERSERERESSAECTAVVMKRCPSYKRASVKNIKIWLAPVQPVLIPCLTTIHPISPFSP
jgi:hypothetical protein